MASTTPSTQVLLVEDSLSDADLVRTLLVSNSVFEVKHVDSLSAAIEELTHWRFNAILLDLTLPDSEGLNTVTTVKSRAGDTPIVVLTGIEDEQTALRAVQLGAQDFLVKQEFDANLLNRSVRYAIERAQLERDRNGLVGRLLELSDEKQQRLYASLVNGVGLPVREIATASSSPSKELQQVIDELDQVMRELDPIRFQNDGLSGALTDLCSTKQYLSGIPCQANTRHASALSEVSVCTHIYRIMEEAVSNAVRHANASKIELRVSRDGDLIKLCVQDDGLGFEVESDAMGFGLQMMEHRAKLLGGELLIESNLGRGTAITYTCNLVGNTPEL